MWEMCPLIFVGAANVPPLNLHRASNEKKDPKILGKKDEAIHQALMYPPT
jgi:hypothetical protein